MKKHIIIHILILISLNIFAQSGNRFHDENITLITDRYEYIPGENLWFKVFLSTNNEKLLSKIVYAELISPYSFSVDRKKLLIDHGSTSGKFLIPDTVSTGYYTILVYTNYAKNKGSENFEKKKVFIYNPEKSYRGAKVNHDFQIDFSMENNNLVDGLNCRIYYKSNKHTEFKIIANKIDTINPKHNKQFNYIEFLPEINTNYSVQSISMDGNTKLIQLPAVKQNGIISNVTEINTDKIVIKTQSTAAYREHNSVVYLSINDQDSVQELYLNDKEVFVQLNEKLFNKDKNIIKIKNAYNKVLWERVIKLDNIASTKVEITDLENKYNKRSKVTFSIKIPEISKDEFADICISIRKTYTNSTILKSENVSLLKKNISKLFDEEYKDSSVSAYWENYGPIISGIIIDNNKNPLSNVNIYLSHVDSAASIQVDKTDENGIFKFVIYSNNNLSDLIIKADTDEDATIIVENNYLNSYSFNDDFYGIKDSSYVSYLDELYLNSRINEIYKIKEQEEELIEKNNDNDNWISYNFYGAPDKTISFNNYVLLDSIHEYFYEFFPSVNINYQNGKRTFKVVDHAKEVLESQPAVLIDGVLYENHEILFTIDPADCNRIEIINSKYIIYDKIYGGVVSLYTKDFNLNKVPIPNNSIRIDYKLYDVTSKFKNISHFENIPDFRNTLYWESDTKIHSNEKHTINFLTGDDKSKYEIIIFGFTNDNLLIKERRTFEVH